MIIFFLFVYVTDASFVIKIDPLLIDPQWSQISVDPHEIIATQKGINLLKEKGIPHSIESHVRGRRKHLRELYDWNCTEPLYCREFIIGYSNQGHPLKGARLTDFSRTTRKRLPEFVYIGNIHGDETVGRYVLARLIEDLQQQPKFLKHLDIYIIPSVNPDGFLLGRRTNANGFDLNRNFPDQFGWGTHPRQCETQAIMDWMNQHHFVMGANLHGGSIVANYGFDGNRQRRSGIYCAAPDDTTLRYISSVYATNHQRMKQSREFPSGITNGCAWYVLYGGLQDWAYLNQTQYHITLELSNTKDPYRLAPYWSENKKALYAYMKHAMGF